MWKTHISTIPFVISQSWTCRRFRASQVMPPKFTPVTETVDQEMVAFWWLWSGNANIWGLQQLRGVALKHLCLHLSCVCLDPHILEQLQRSRGQYAQLRLFSSANFEVQSPRAHIHMSLFHHMEALNTNFMPICIFKAPTISCFCWAYCHHSNH